MGSYYIFFRSLPDLLRAAEYRSPVLKPLWETLDHFYLSQSYPFILKKALKCEEKEIPASNKNSLFCTSLSYMVDPHMKKEHQYKSDRKVKRLFDDFKAQPFFNSAILCPQYRVKGNWIKREDGSQYLKEGQYFPSVVNMVRYTHEHGIIHLDEMEKEEKEIVEKWLNKKPSTWEELERMKRENT